MILYHGSSIAVEHPDVPFSRKLLDFGKGFYTTPIREQAWAWAEHFKKDKGTGVVNAYAFMERYDETLDSFNVLEFDTHSLDWLNFITACRRGKAVDSTYDLIIGGVANDKVFLTLELYFEGLLPSEEAIRRLRYNKPSHQYCFKNQQIIEARLHFIGSEDV